MVFLLVVRFLDCVIKAALCLNVLNLSLYQTRNTDLRAQCQPLADALCVIDALLVAYILQLRFEVPRTITGRVITQHIQWHFAGMQPIFAQFNIDLDLRRLAKLILESTAFHVLVCCFIDLHFQHSFFCFFA